MYSWDQGSILGHIPNQGIPQNMVGQISGQIGNTINPQIHNQLQKQIQGQMGPNIANQLQNNLNNMIPKVPNANEPYPTLFQGIGNMPTFPFSIQQQKQPHQPASKPKKSQGRQKRDNKKTGAINIPYNVAQPIMMDNIPPEYLIILRQMSADKIDFFCRLFEIPYPQPLPDITNAFYCVWFELNKRHKAHLIRRVFEFFSTEEKGKIDQLMDPAIPRLLAKNPHMKSIYKIIQLHEAPFDFTPKDLIHNPDNQQPIIIGMFISDPLLPPPNGTVKVNDEIVQTLNFGEPFPYYFLSPYIYKDGKPNTIHIQITASNSDKAIVWFVIIYTYQNKAFIKEFASSNHLDPECIRVSTPFCKGCQSFPFNEAIANTCKTGSFSCPHCKKRCLLNDITIDKSLSNPAKKNRKKKSQSTTKETNPKKRSDDNSPMKDNSTPKNSSYGSIPGSIAPPQNAVLFQRQNGNSNMQKKIISSQPNPIPVNIGGIPQPYIPQQNSQSSQGHSVALPIPPKQPPQPIHHASKQPSTPKQSQAPVTPTNAKKNHILPQTNSGSKLVPLPAKTPQSSTQTSRASSQSESNTKKSKENETKNDILQFKIEYALMTDFLCTQLKCVKNEPDWIECVFHPNPHPIQNTYEEDSFDEDDYIDHMGSFI